MKELSAKEYFKLLIEEGVPDAPILLVGPTGIGKSQLCKDNKVNEVELQWEKDLQEKGNIIGSAIRKRKEGEWLVFTTTDYADGDFYLLEDCIFIDMEDSVYIDVDDA